MIVFKVFGGRGTVGVRGMTIFKPLGGRGTVGVRGMTLFKLFGERGTVGVRGMTIFKNTRQHRRSLGQGEGCVCANAGKAGRGRVALYRIPI